MQPSMRNFIFALLVLVPLGCHKSSPAGPDDGTVYPGDGYDGGTDDAYFAPSGLEVTGHMIDFETKMPLASTATMATAALSPPPSVSVTGADFTLASVPPFSVFYLLAG